MKVVEKNKMTNKKENENGLCTLIVEGRGRKFEKGNYLITSIQHRHHHNHELFSRAQIQLWRQSSTMLVTSPKVVIVIMIYAQR